MSKIKFRRARKALGIAMTAAMICTVAMPAFASSSAVNVQDPGANTTGSTAPVGYQMETDGTDEVTGLQNKAATNQVDAKLTIRNVPGNDHVFETFQIFTGDISNRFSDNSDPNNPSTANRVLANVKWGTGLNLDGTDHKGQPNPKSFLDALIANDDVPNKVTARTNAQKDVELKADMSAQDFAEYLGNLENDDSTLRKIAEIITSENGKYLGSSYKDSNAPTAYDPPKYTDTGIEMFEYTFTELPAGYYITRDKSGEQDPELENLTRNILKLVGDSFVNTKSDTVRSYKKVEENTKYNKNDKINIDDDNVDANANNAGYETVNAPNGNSDGSFDKGYNDTADYDIGDTIPFEFIAPIIEPKEIEKFKDPYKYVFHDNMSKGLTLDEDSFQVGIFDKDTAEYDFANAKKVLSSPGEYTYSGITKDPTTGNQYFTITINDMKAWVTQHGIAKNDLVVVRFTAKLNDDAVIGMPSEDPDDKNYQRMYLEYSNNPNGDGTGTTPEDENVVFTYELDVNKIDGQDKAALADAYFVFYKYINGVKNYAVTKTVNGKSHFVRWAVPTGGELKDDYTQQQLDRWNQDWTQDDKNAFVATYDNQFTLNDGETVVLKSREDSEGTKGTFEIVGIDDTKAMDDQGNIVEANPYFLHEIKAPKGYNLMDKDIRVEIEADTHNGQNSDLKLGKLERKFDTTKRILTDAEKANLENYVYEGTPDAQDGSIPTGTVDGTIANNRGTVLPSTGGMGTTLFYTIGGVLLVGAAILLVTRKRVAEVH